MKQFPELSKQVGGYEESSPVGHLEDLEPLVHPANRQPKLIVGIFCAYISISITSV
jgi:hypothetical protein